ncbi:polysaccharide pyruvyl transferase family protein [Sphingomonas sp. ID0503]|uniref:polysaccharide pyruvyl transferase family protein n=1 Tax=Sphingomonas sp. ID0503 TaxID=3399691 RepID=UPI003AFA7BEB
MRVGVLTFHRCVNYGSYWQARCLVEGLRARGLDAVLLDHDAEYVRRVEWRCAFQPTLPVRTPRADLPLYAAKGRKFLAAFDALPQSPRFPLDHPEEAGSYDVVLVGSDEVWNFRHPWYGYKPLFFGTDLRTGRLASYAASFGNHDAAQGIEPGWAEKLAAFDCLSVRDENSRTLIRESIGREPSLVLDPCLQFPPPAPEPVEGTPYLAVYGHGFPNWFAAQLRTWADKNARRVVSIGYRNDWADEQLIEAGPEEFSALIASADAVATNFFHGCVFALLHQRPFVSAPSAYRFNKVRDLAALLGAERHIVFEATGAEDYAALLGAPLDPPFQDRIAAMRVQSDDYLRTVFG